MNVASVLMLMIWKGLYFKLHHLHIGFALKFIYSEEDHKILKESSDCF